MMGFSKEVEDLLVFFDREHISHRYASMINCSAAGSIKTEHDCQRISDREEKDQSEITNGIPSWGYAIHGYENKRLNDTLISKVDRMPNLMLEWFRHDCAMTLSQKLLNTVNHKKLQHCFLTDSGSIAVEVAMKTAFQYQLGLGNRRKSKFLTISSGYHGDMKGDTGMCDPIGSMHSIYEGILGEIIIAKAPSMIGVVPTASMFERYNKSCPKSIGCGRDEDGKPLEEIIAWKEDDMNDFREKMELHHDELCAVIMEPILQATGGMRLYHPQFLIEVRKLCNQYEIPLILDETITGFGRTGTMFAFRHCELCQDYDYTGVVSKTDVYPDMMCVGNALTGGYFASGAIITTSEMAFEIPSSDNATGDCMIHGSRFTRNPLACLVAKESLNMLNIYKDHVDRIEEQLFKKLFVPLKEEIKRKKIWIVQGVRIVGALGIIELKVPIDQKWLVSRGIYVGQFRNICYIMPPYTGPGSYCVSTIRVDVTPLISALKEWQKIRVDMFPC